MELVLLDHNFSALYEIDAFKSLIWDEYYNQEGDFELVVSLNSPLVSTLSDINNNDYYLYLKGSEKIMILEAYNIKTSVQDGYEITVTGRSIESLLGRRITTSQVTFDGNIQDFVSKILNENFINPSDPNRKMDNFIFIRSDDTRLDRVDISIQTEKGSILDLINDLCNDKMVGYKMYPFTDTDGIIKIAFKLYIGVDRSYSQFNNPYIVYSHKNNNLINTTFDCDTSPMKNIGMIIGDNINMKTFVGENEPTGYNRRELFVDANSVSKYDDNGQEMSHDQYVKLLQYYSDSQLTENSTTNQFEGQADIYNAYTFGIDYNLGDIVQMENEIGLTQQVFVDSYIRSESTNGIEEYPTFIYLD